MSSIWHSLTHIGIRKELDLREARRIFYTNIIVVLTSLYLLARILLSLADMVYCIKLFSMNLFVVSVLVLNYFHFYRVAKIVMFSAWVSCVTYISYFYLGGFHGGTSVLLFATVPWPFMLFDLDRNKKTVLSLLSFLLLAFGTIITLQYIRPLSATVHLDMEVVRISMTVLTILFLLLITWFHHSNNLAAESILRSEKEKTEKSKEAAEAANRAKSAFLANMSHELRTPLNAILGFSELMRREPDISTERQQNLETISRSGKHLLSLINDILEFSKIEAGRTVLKKEAFELRRLLLGLEDMFELRARQKRISLEFTCHPDVPKFVRADKNKLRQILINLLGNAVKFTENGSIRLSVKNQQGDMGDDRRRILKFEVADTGCGIPGEEQKRIFDAFYQSGNQYSSHQGAGLGLSISRKFANLMGGDLAVVSEIGNGTCFALNIVVEVVDGCHIASHHLNRRIISLAPDQPAFRLLVVEDDEDSRRLLVTLLAAAGFDVRETVNGREAVEIWRQWRPHLIWMDIRMPVMDGYEATAAIRAEAAKSHSGVDVKIIALTANAFEEDRLNVMAHGGDDFIRKPFRGSEIFEMIHKHLGVRYQFDEREGTLPTNRSGPMFGDTLPHRLGQLPEALLIRLKEATELSDAVRIDKVIRDIVAKDNRLGGALSRLAGNFEYDKILDLVCNL